MANRNATAPAGTRAADVVGEPREALVEVLDVGGRRERSADLARRYAAVRRFSEELSAPLSAEDCTIQSMPDVSPTKWHLAHTTWFFETFVLSQQPGYTPAGDGYAYLFNSYYETVGRQFPRSQRGLLSRPGLLEVLDYRRRVDDAMLALLASWDGANDRAAAVIELGLQHEQQHQELILTDIQHVLSQHPQWPVYRSGNFAAPARDEQSSNLRVEAGLYHLGHEGSDFAFDNESPRHRAWLEGFELDGRLVTCGEYLRFIEDGGYRRPDLWLSLGWQAVRERGWNAPLYWFEGDGGWQHFTLAGPRPVDDHLPVCHVSYFEADAYARWAGRRLPTEAEWEVASALLPIAGNFADKLIASDHALHPGSRPADEAEPRRMFGDVWEWMASPYVPYPGYSPPEGSLGEYNGKFMCNQYVLRGGSCATPAGHVRRTYRNFFPPDARWQFTGIRLCR